MVSYFKLEFHLTYLFKLAPIQARTILEYIFPIWIMCEEPIDITGALKRNRREINESFSILLRNSLNKFFESVLQKYFNICFSKIYSQVSILQVFKHVTKVAEIWISTQI